MLTQGTLKCSQTFGILAACSFLISSVTTVPSRILAEAICDRFFELVPERGEAIGVVVTEHTEAAGVEDVERHPAAF